LNRSIRSTRIGEIQISYERGKKVDGARVIPAEISALVPAGKSFGFDTIWDVTRMRHVECMQREEIQRIIPFHIATGSISNLSREGLAYFSICQANVAAQLGDYFRREAFILNIDGTNEGGQYNHYRCIDNLTGIVVYCRKIRSENAEEIAEVLREIIRLYGKPHAVVSDMSAPTRKAIIEVLGEDFPHLICQFHFLRDVGKELLVETHEKLRGYISKHAITHKLKRYKTKLAQLIPKASGELREDYLKVHEFVLWILDYSNELSGKGVPFDLKWLHYYERCETAAIMINELEKKYAPPRKKGNRKNALPGVKPGKFWVQLTYIRSSLQSLLKNKYAAAKFKELKKQNALFLELREAFHSVKSNEDILAEKQGAPLSESCSADFSAASAREVRQNLNAIKERIQIKNEKTASEAIILIHIEKYFEFLTVELVINGKSIPLPRTNNMCETNFRNTKRNIRMVAGQKNLSKVMDQTPAEIAYLQNIDNPIYKEIVFGTRNVCDVFSEVEPKAFKNTLKQISEAMPECHVGKAIRKKSFIKNLQSYFAAS
jgi:hypothetical protein